MTTIYLEGSRGHTCLSTVAIDFGHLPLTLDLPLAHKPLYGSHVPVFASEVQRYGWAVYGFNSGHFLPTVHTHNLPFELLLAADTRPQGRALFK